MEYRRPRECGVLFVPLLMMESPRPENHHSDHKADQGMHRDQTSPERGFGSTVAESKTGMHYGREIDGTEWCTGIAVTFKIFLEPDAVIHHRKDGKNRKMNFDEMDRCWRVEYRHALYLDKKTHVDESYTFENSLEYVSVWRQERIDIPIPGLQVPRKVAHREF